MPGGNDSLAAVFGELVQLTILEEGDPNSFRVRAYERARETILSHRGELGALSEKELTQLDGIGSSTAKKIREFFQSGAIAKVEELRKKYPPEFVELSRIPGLGPKTLARLRAELGVRNVEDLRTALDGQKLREVKGLGEKAEQKIRLAVERIGTAREGEPPADRRGDADRPRAGRGARGATRRRARPVLRQPAPAARDRGRRRHRGRLARAVLGARGLPEDARSPRGARRRGHQDVRPDRDRPPGRPARRRPALVRRGLPVLHRLEGPQHQAAPARPRAGLASQRVRPDRQRDGPGNRLGDGGGRLPRARAAARPAADARGPGGDRAGRGG